jgi:hypothetical protein
VNFNTIYPSLIPNKALKKRYRSYQNDGVSFVNPLPENMKNKTLQIFVKTTISGVWKLVKGL